MNFTRTWIDSSLWSSKLMKPVANPTKIYGFPWLFVRFCCACHDGLPRRCHVMFVSRLFGSSSSTLHGSFCRGCQHPKKVCLKSLQMFFKKCILHFFSESNTVYHLYIPHLFVVTPQVVSFVISGLLAAVMDFIPWKLRELPPSETQHEHFEENWWILVASPSQSIALCFLSCNSILNGRKHRSKSGHVQASYEN